MNPTEEFRSALIHAEYHAHFRFISQCFPDADFLDMQEGDIGDTEFVIRAGEKLLFRFCGPSSIDFESDLFALDLQDYIEARTREGMYYEKSIKTARQDLLKKLGLPNWAAANELFDSCKSIIGNTMDDEYPADIKFMATTEMSPLEKEAYEVMHSVFDRPYHVLPGA